MEKHSNSSSLIISVYHPDEKAQKMIRMSFQSGRFERAMEIAQRMHRMRLLTAEIVEATGLTVEEVEEAQERADDDE